MKNNLGALLLWVSNKLDKNQDILIDKLDAVQHLFETSAEATASPADILEGQTAYNGTTLITGTMADQGAKEATLLAGQSYTIPKGYHDGSGRVEATDLASQTEGTAEAGGILSGLKAWVSGEQITGTMPDRRATTVEAAAVTQDEEYTYLDLPEGEACYSGNSKVRTLNSNLKPVHILKLEVEAYDATELERGSSTTEIDTARFKRMTIGSCEGSVEVRAGDSISGQGAKIEPTNGIYDLTNIDSVSFILYPGSGISADPGGQFANWWRKSVIKDIYLY